MSSGLGKKRQAEDRLDRGEYERGEAAPSAAPAAAASPAAPTSGFAPRAAPAVAPAVTTGGSTTPSPFAALATASGLAKPPAAASGKFSFNFGPATPAAPAAGSDATKPAAAAAAPAFQFNFGQVSRPTATATTAGAATNGGAPQFSFGAHNKPADNKGTAFDFSAGVKAFAAAATAKAATPAESAADDGLVEDADVAPVRSNGATAAATLLSTPVSEVTGLEADTVLMEVAGTKVCENEAGSWKERGVGDLKITRYQDTESGAEKHRIVMHSAQTKRLVINVPINSVFGVVNTTDKYVTVRTIAPAAAATEGGQKDAPAAPTMRPAMYLLRMPQSAQCTEAEKLLKELAAKVNASS